jgi:hypothetical protein
VCKGSKIGLFGEERNHSIYSKEGLFLVVFHIFSLWHSIGKFGIASKGSQFGLDHNFINPNRLVK